MIWQISQAAHSTSSPPARIGWPLWAHRSDPFGVAKRLAGHGYGHLPMETVGFCFDCVYLNHYFDIWCVPVTIENGSRLSQLHPVRQVSTIHPFLLPARMVPVLPTIVCDMCHQWSIRPPVRPKCRATLAIWFRQHNTLLAFPLLAFRKLHASTKYFNFCLNNLLQDGISYPPPTSKNAAIAQRFWPKSLACFACWAVKNVYAEPGRIPG